MKYTREFIFDMPKTDLHLHLDGSLRLNSLIEMAGESNINLPSNTIEGMKEKVFKETYENLGDYLKGFQYTCDVLRDKEHIERAAYELAIDNQKENVIYIEVRFAPQLLVDVSRGLTMEVVLKAASDGLERAKKEYNLQKEVINGARPPFNYGIIACAMRMFGPKGFSPYYTNLYNVMPYSKESAISKAASMDLALACVKLRDEKGFPIVGIDLAGQEEGYPAHKFKDAYEYAHKNFLHKTVHAGEAYGAESIFQAITDCYADRIGHGYSLFLPDRIVDPSISNKKDYIEKLASYIADKRTVIEVCLTSNMQTNPTINSIKDHKFKDMLDARMATTICTDNRLVSNTTVTDEYMLAVDNFNIPIKRLKDIVAYGFKKSFFNGSYVEKRAYAKQVMDYLSKIIIDHGVK